MRAPLDLFPRHKRNDDRRKSEGTGRVLFRSLKGAAPLLALVLFTAAVMKAVQLATVPVLGEGLFHARWFEFCLVEYELAFGLLLLGGQLPGWTRLAVIALFSLFGLVSLFKALSGEALLRLFRRGGRDVVCVEIPPYGEESCVPDNLVHVKLTDRYDWYIETPKLLPAARLK